MAGRCNASQDAQEAWDAGDASLASRRNADGSDAGSVFADEYAVLEDVARVENEISRFRDEFFFPFYPYYCLTRAVRFPLRHGVM